MLGATVRPSSPQCTVGTRLVGHRRGDRGSAVDRAAKAYARRSGAWICFLVHLAAWIGVATEACLALQLAGAPLGFGSILVIESLLYAIRSAAFVVPNAIGVQEGDYVVLGAGFGLTPDVAMAPSFLKRGRDLLIGTPALLAWQFIEGRRFWKGE